MPIITREDRICAVVLLKLSSSTFERCGLPCGRPWTRQFLLPPARTRRLESVTRSAARPDLIRSMFRSLGSDGSCMVPQGMLKEEGRKG
ncbi:Hypothetical protein NTJ_07593 [Nesidiocoris tenuis]|uniref:Uncharacterized protein n=1 Tax=Nesidiocoris tenuis TaxID=355587 RepID=A0ABN7AU10_9HEMI|nr:Hypothetical protein NTJ_07593 [Nesidiocoris tenuis]